MSNSQFKIHKSQFVFMKRTKIVDALAKTVFGEAIDVKGWVRTHRSSKAVDFIALNDGSTIKNIQIVVDPAKFDAEMLKQITTGACIHVQGLLVESQGAGQTCEIQAETIEVYGTCGADYPMQKKGQSFEYMRQHATTWQWLYTPISMSMDTSTSILLSSLPVTVRVQEICSRLQPRTSIT